MKKLVVGAVVSLFFGSAVMANAEEAKSALPEDTISPVKIEMRLLNDAYMNLIEALVLNSPDIIEDPFSQVHGARANTEKAIEKGHLKLPKNNDKMKQFVEFDEQFHDRLETLIEAAGKKDMEKVRAVTHKLLDGCVQCHNTFRD